MPSDVAYDTMLLFWRIVTNLFFREIRPRGAFNIPKDGPVIFVAAPHHNQFLDPLLLMLEAFRDAHRRVSFLIAAKSMKRKAVGFFASMMNSIPVARAADSAKPGTGTITISEDDPTLVRGVGTQFSKELSPRCSIMLPKSTNFATAEVIQVISDTEARVKKEFGGDSGKGTSKIVQKLGEAKEQGREGLDFKVLPHIDQQEMYAHVYKQLKNGGCIGIFPEGGSHDRTDLLPLKAGVSLMALGAMAADPTVKVKIVPVGLSYFHPHRFRSRAVVEFGPAMDVPQELIEMFKQGGDNKRTACQKLLDLIYDGLKTVTLRAPDYETLMVIQAGRRLYKTPGQHLTLGQVVELNKRFIEGYLHFQHEPRVQKLRENVLKYNRLVRDLGLRDHQVPRATKAGWKTLGLLTYRIGLLLVWTIFALPGVILNGPIFLLASIISRKKAKEALAASTVKVAGRDVLATWKVLISLGVAPVLYTFYAVVATIIATKANAPLKWRIWTPFLVILALPCIGYAALKFGEAGMDVLKSLRPLVVSLFPGQQKLLEKLKEQRQNLSNEVVDVINEFGPKLYDDFDETRILVPSASVPPSSGTPGLWRRKSGTGGVDAQGNLLVHPLTWLDERLFGWSRSARRGTSAWSGAPGSVDASRHVSPEASDDEDTGDYDNVLGFLPAIMGSGTGLSPRQKPRSLRGSYADLQSLRRAEGEAGPHKRNRSGSHLAPVYQKSHHVQFEVGGDGATSSALEHDESSGPHLRKGPRERRASLSDDVKVARIGELSPLETFKDATADINRENSFNRQQRAAEQGAKNEKEE